MPDDLSKDETAEAAHRALRPDHCVAGDGLLRRVVRLTGRPRKVKVAPDADAREYARRLCEIAEGFVAEDPVVKAVARQHDRTDPEIIDCTLMELARESGSLNFEKSLLLGEGRDSAQVSSRRTEVLSRMARIVLERARAGVEETFDPRDDRVQRIMGEFVRAMAECARETLGSADAERFLTRFEELAKGWEDRVTD